MAPPPPPAALPADDADALPTARNVREQLRSLTEDCRKDDTVVVAHGEDDRIVDVQTAYHLTEQIPRATLALYPGIGHAPFWEASERFDRELAAFAGAPALA